LKNLDNNLVIVYCNVSVVNQTRNARVQLNTHKSAARL